MSGIVKHIQSSFASGLVSYPMLGRIDLAEKFNSACIELYNFTPTVQGGLFFRPGLQWISDGESIKQVTFSPESDKSFILSFTAGLISVYSFTDNIINRDPNKIAEIVVPYSASEILEINTTYRGSELIIAHENHYPSVVSYTDGSFSFNQLDFTCLGPTDKSDSNDPLLRITGESRIRKLISPNTTEFRHVSYDGDVTHVEFSVDGVKTLGRVLFMNSTPRAPKDPDDIPFNVCYVSPVVGVVDDIPSEAKFAVVDENYINDDISEVDEGVLEIRSTVQMFNSDFEGSYIRITNDYENLCPYHGTYGGSPPYDYCNYVPGGPKFSQTAWYRLTEFIGLKPFSTEFLPAVDGLFSVNRSDLKIGNNYQIIRPYGINPMRIIVGSNNDGDGGYRYDTAGDTFSLQNRYFFEDGADGGFIMNISERSDFDVMEVDLSHNYAERIVGVHVHECTDGAWIDDTFGGYTVDLSSNEDFFGSEYYINLGEQLYVNVNGQNVLVRISSITDSVTATAEVIDGSFSRNANGDIANDGEIEYYYRQAWTDGNYPRTVTYYEQRLVFAGTPNEPEAIWLSNLIDDTDFRLEDGEGDVLATSAIKYTLQGETLNDIVGLQTGPVLIIATESHEWQLRPNTFGDAITSENIRITIQTSVGSNGQTLRIGSSIFFPLRRGTNLLEYVYNYEIDGFEELDTQVFASDIFLRDPIAELAYQRRPRPIIWARTETNNLFFLVYEKKQGVYAWSELRTNGLITSISVLQSISSLHSDRVVLCVNRDGHHAMEALGDEFYDDGSDNFKPNMNFLDSYIRFPETGYLTEDQSLFNVPHLADKEIYAIVDGREVGPLTVSSSGDVTLTEFSASKYAVFGFKYTGKATLLPLTTQGNSGPTFGERKKITKAVFQVYKSLGFSAYTDDPNNGNTTASPVSFANTDDVMGQSPKLISGFVYGDVSDDYDTPSQLSFLQTQAYPLYITAVILDVRIDTDV